MVSQRLEFKGFLHFSFHNWELREENNDWVTVTQWPQPELNTFPLKEAISTSNNTNLMKEASFHKNHETTPHLLNTHRDGRGVTRYRNVEKVNQGDGQPYADDWHSDFSPLDAVFWICSVRSLRCVFTTQIGSHRAVLSTPSQIKFHAFIQTTCLSIHFICHTKNIFNN